MIHLRSARSAKGFSLIELLVVVALFSIISIAAVGLFLSTLQGNNTTNAQAVIKESGNYALNSMGYIIRNSQQITSCSANSITLQNRDGGTSTFFVNATNQVASQSGTETLAQAESVTTNNVRVDPPDADLTGLIPPMFTCTPAGSPTTVSIRFIIRKGDPATDNARDVVTQTFGTTVGLRRY